MIDGMLWILHTGAPWRDLPERFGPWKTVYERFRRWTREGLWDKILDRMKEGKPDCPVVDWTLVCVDGSLARAHRHAAGASKNACAGA
jgi:transposase